MIGKDVAGNALYQLQECNEETFPPNDPVNNAILIAKKALEEYYERAVEEYYLEHKGVRCPFCDSYNIEGSSWEVIEGKATQEVRCIDCGVHWEDEYTLTGMRQAD